MPVFALAPAAAAAFWGATGAGVAAGASLYGAHEQASAATDAASLQAKAAQDALDFQKQKEAQDQANFIATQKANYAQYVAQQARLAPYQASGAAAAARLNTGLGLSPQALPALPPPPDYTMFSGTGSSVTPNASAQTYAPQTTSTLGPSTLGSMVTYRMKAPNGDVSTVPASQKDYYLSKGATVIG